MALLAIFRPEIFSAWTVIEEQQGLGRAGTASGTEAKAGGGRFGEDTYADDNDATTSLWSVDISALDWTGDTIFITMNYFLDAGTDGIPGSKLFNMNDGQNDSTDAWSFVTYPNGEWYFLNDANNDFVPTVSREQYRLKPQCWNTIEISVLQSESAPLVTVKINGVTCMNAVNVADTGGAAIWDWVNFFGITSTSSTEDGVWYGDIIINDDTGSTFNSFIGDFRFETAVPDADGATVAWTRNTGASDYLAIDDAIGSPDDDTTYIESTVAAEDAYASYPAATLTDVDTIHFVALCSRVRDDAGAAPLKVSHLAENDANVTVATAKDVAATYEYVIDFFEQNPTGPATWTKTTIDTGEYGIRSVT